jgi:hypothetical protein
VYEESVSSAFSVPSVGIGIYTFTAPPGFKYSQHGAHRARGEKKDDELSAEEQAVMKSRIVDTRPYWRLRTSGDSRKLGIGQEFMGAKTSRHAAGVMILPADPDPMGSKVSAGS